MSLFASKGTARQPDPEPLRTNDVPVVAAGTGLWAGALVVLLVLRARGADVEDWWMAMCVCGIALGLIGVRVCQVRQRGDRRRDEPPQVSPLP